MDKKELKELIESDLYRYTADISMLQFLRNILRNPGYKYMYILRKCKYYKQRKSTIIPYIFYKLMLDKYKYKFGYEIPENVRLGKGIYINHLGGVVINPNAVLGNNINITKGVTIGQTNRGNKSGAPIIGDRVWIGANSTVVGKVTIGNNVLIAPNSYVNFDVPSNSIVVGNEVKKSDFATDQYVNNLA